MKGNHYSWELLVSRSKNTSSADVKDEEKTDELHIYRRIRNLDLHSLSVDFPVSHYTSLWNTNNFLRTEKLNVTVYNFEIYLSFINTQFEEPDPLFPNYF